MKFLTFFLGSSHLEELFSKWLEHEIALARPGPRR